MSKLWYIINKYFSKGTKMARPRSIKLELGTVELQNFPKEEADKLQQYIESYNSPCVEKLVEATKEVINSELANKAVGTRHVEGNHYQLITVAYNAETKEASVQTIKDCNGKVEAVKEFKRAAVENKFAM